jgi:hypothetical protein
MQKIIQDIFECKNIKEQVSEFPKSEQQHLMCLLGEGFCSSTT